MLLLPFLFLADFCKFFLLEMKRKIYLCNLVKCILCIDAVFRKAVYERYIHELKGNYQSNNIIMAVISITSTLALSE